MNKLIILGVSSPLLTAKSPEISGHTEDINLTKPVLAAAQVRLQSRTDGIIPR